MPFLTRFLLFVVIALVLGLGTAWRTVSHGFFASTVRFGPWAYWLRQGTPDADPYTIAHIAREGTLPITAAADMTFTATRDSAGAHLTGDCTYEVRGYSVPALWWSIAAFRTDGQVMPNKTGRSSFPAPTSRPRRTGLSSCACGRRCSPEIGFQPSAESAWFFALKFKAALPGSSPQVGEDIVPVITLVECS